LTWKPCEAHGRTHRECPETCKNGKWVRVESKRWACKQCVERKKKCTHGLGAPTEAPVKREPDLATYQKPAGGKTKRVQEDVPVSSTAPKEPTKPAFKSLFPEQDPEKVIQRYAEEEALEAALFGEGYRKVLQEFFTP
jgi:hypothetical protein